MENTSPSPLGQHPGGPQNETNLGSSPQETPSRQLRGLLLQRLQRMGCRVWGCSVPPLLGFLPPPALRATTKAPVPGWLLGESLPSPMWAGSLTPLQFPKHPKRTTSMCRGFAKGATAGGRKPRDSIPGVRDEPGTSPASRRILR